MDNIPPYISLVFVATTLATLGFVIYSVDVALKKQKPIAFYAYTGFLITWLIATSFLASKEFFLDLDFRPPKLFPFVAFFILTGLSVFFFRTGREILQKLPITSLTYLHIIRVPVEIVLWWLFLQGKVDKDMTFEGMNYDILSGITAPFAALFLVGQKTKSRIGAIIWNLLALGLLVNIVSRAIMATPYFFDPARFDIPNVAVLYSPYVWLPAFIVPCVFLAHIVSLYQLFREKEE
ncbi:MAG: hypothetical protein ACFHWX_07580 [Bacteroidota bacterium]